MAKIVELSKTKELRATSKALKNHLSNYSVVKEVGIIYINIYIVAITFITLKEEIEAKTKTIGTRDVYKSPITELIGFEIDIVLIETKIDIVLVKIEIDIMLVETKEDIISVKIKIDIILAGTGADIVLVKTKIDIILVRTKTALVLVGTKVDIVQVGTKVNIVLIGTRIDA